MSEATKANDLTEDYVRRKLKHMCMKPRRTIMNFLDESKDRSLFDWLKQRNEKIAESCPTQSCKLPNKNHSDYYNHNNGCVVVKSAPFVLHDPKDPYFKQPSLKVKCMECMRDVMPTERIPFDLLEISFAKFLE
mgnify:CR=1 FL=1